jgi:thioesterase domain-containing protein
MADLEAVRAMLTQGVPFNRVLGVRVEAAEDERAEVSMPEAPERLNHVGTVHAAALFGLGEATSGAMVVAALNDLYAGGYVPLAVDASIRYRRPAKGDLRGAATLPRDEQQRIRAQVREAGRSRFTVPVQIVDAGGTVVAEMDVAWMLLTPRQ